VGNTLEIVICGRIIVFIWLFTWNAVTSHRFIDTTMQIIKFLKEWTLPAAITFGTTVYLLFRYIPALDRAGDELSPVIDQIFPLAVFLTLFVTFCKVDFHQMRLHRWHAGVLVAQLALVALIVWLAMQMEHRADVKLLAEGMLTCVIAPTASAAPVVANKLGGDINTMTTQTLVSSLVAALMIPAVFPLLETVAHVTFWSAFFIILKKIAVLLVLPLVLGWLVRHYIPKLHKVIVDQPNLGFYTWSVALSITTGITVKNIMNSDASIWLLLLIAVASLVMCWVQFGIGRLTGRWLGEEINAGQGMFQKNTALSIWVAYMYLNPVASIGAGFYVLWQNIINSIELWYDRKKTAAD